MSGWHVPHLPPQMIDIVKIRQESFKQYPLWKTILPNHATISDK